MGTIDDKQNDPLHSGEIFHLWNYLYRSKADLVTMQILINHTEDKDLELFLEDLLENSFMEEAEQIEAYLKETGIRLPPAPPDRPNVDVHDIPAGARFHDAEIVLFIQKELMNGKIVCSYLTSMCNQADIISLFSEFYSIRSDYEEKLLKLSKEKGWHVFPPIHIQ